MARSVDTITKKRVTPKTAESPVATAPIQPAKTVAAPVSKPRIKVSAPLPPPPQAQPQKKVVAKRAAKSRPSPKITPPASSFEHRRKYLAPLVAGGLAVIMIVWAVFGAAMHPRQTGDTFFASFTKNFNVASIKDGWDRILHGDNSQEAIIRKAEQEIFPQFETTVTTK